MTGFVVVPDSLVVGLYFHMKIHAQYFMRNASPNIWRIKNATNIAGFPLPAPSD